MRLTYKKKLLQQLLFATTILSLATLSVPVVSANTTEEIASSTIEAPAAEQENTSSEAPTSDALPVDEENSETPSSQEEEISLPETNPENDIAQDSSTISNQEKAGTGTLRSAPLTSTTDNQIINLETSTVYLSEPASLSENITLTETNLVPLTWTLDGKPLDDWKTWDLKEGDFVGDPFITIEESQINDQYLLSIELNALFGSDLSKRTPSNIRRTYRQYMKEFLLQGISIDGSLTINKVLNFRPYESYQTHEEMLADIEASRENAASDRLVTIETIGQSAQGRDIKMAVVAKDQESIDDYLNTTTPLMLTQPDQMLSALQAGQFDYKLPILINNTHADEQPGIDIVTSLFRDFATKDSIDYTTTDEQGQVIQHQLIVSELLEKFIFLFNFTENPDGNVLNLRSLVNGLDPNRDTGFQVNPETRAIVTQIHKWNPISVLDIHGFVSSFLIEPATPPHDPNFEYDLLADLMLEKAHEMGRAGVANSKYTRYTIPKIDWGDGWDDSFSGYTAVYAMYHGILGHTIEIPETNQESFKAGFYAVLGGIHYLSTKPEDLMTMRLTYYSRGVNKIEDPKAEAELVGPTGEVVGRIKQDQPKFFPDYYVIPMSFNKQVDLEEAFKMIDYFKRNGVLVHQLKQDLGDFKQGDLVVDMAQAKRGFANHVLYSGSNESEWGAMYAELVVNFPDMKGFVAKPIFNEQLFDGLLEEVNWTSAPRTSIIDFKAPYYVIANTSKSAVQAVNTAIAKGSKVYLTNDGFIVETSDFLGLLNDYALYGEPLYKQPVGQALKAMKVYAPSHYYRWAGDFAILANSALALEDMGFEIVSNLEEADAIVLESDQFDATIFGKKPVILVGGTAMLRLEELNLLNGFDASMLENGWDFEGLMKAIIDDQDPLTSGYLANGLFYSNSGHWIDGIPEGFRTLVTIADKDFYIAGWWPGYEQVANKVVAIAGTYLEQPLFIYAGNPTNKVHPVHFFRWLSNALFGTQLASLEELPPVEILVPQEEENQTDLEKPTLHKTTQAGPTKLSTEKILPNTSGGDSSTTLVLGSILCILGGKLLLLRKKEN